MKKVTFGPSSLSDPIILIGSAYLFIGFVITAVLSITVNLGISFFAGAPLLLLIMLYFADKRTRPEGDLGAQRSARANEYPNHDAS